MLVAQTCTATSWQARSSAAAFAKWLFWISELTGHEVDLKLSTGQGASLSHDRKRAADIGQCPSASRVDAWLIGCRTQAGVASARPGAAAAANRSNEFGQASPASGADGPERD